MLVRAGQRAASLAAVVEAQRYYQRAAELSDDALDRAVLLERAGDMAGNAGKHDDAIALLEEAAHLFVSAGASHPAARVSARLGEVLWERGDREKAVQRMEDAFSQLTGDDPDADLGALASMLARSHYLLGDHEKAAERVDTAMEIADLLGLPELASQALTTKSILLDAAGRRAESEALVRHALVIALENDLHVAAIRAYFNLGETVAVRDRFDDGVTYCASGLALARRVGNFMWELRLLGNLLTPLIVLGRWGEAVACAAEMPQPGDQVAGTDVLAGYLPMARLYVRRGDIPAAERLVTAAVSAASSVDLQQSGSYAAAAGAVHAARGEHREALEQGERAFVTVDVFGYAADWIVAGFEVAIEAAFALDDLAAVERLIARSKGSRSLATSRRHQGQVMRYQARLAARRGASDEATAAYDTAAANFRDIGAQVDLADTLLEHAELLDSLGRSESASGMAAEARTIFDRLGAVPSLTRLDATFGDRPEPAGEGRSPAAALPA
jgi:tetratricopeptide (TPR) repeat protein